MKKIFIGFILLFSALNLIAQSSNIHEFGNVSIDDLKMKVYDKDSSATALCMLSSGYVYIDSDWPLGKSSITYHYRFKLFKNASFYLASIKIPIDPSQGISEMKAQTIWLNDNGEIKRQNIDQKDFVENKLINNARLLEFNFPALKDGCIIEYTYKIASWRKYLIPTWYFQSEVPTMYSQLSLEMKQIVNLSSVIKGAHITEDNSTVTQIENTKIYQVRDLPAWKNEPFCISKEDNIDRLDFYIRWPEDCENWSYIGNLYDDAEFYEKSDYFTKISKKICDDNNATTPFQKMIAIRNHVQSWFNWDNDFNNHYGKDLASAYENKIGSNKEVNKVLAKMLINQKIDVKRAYISTKTNGQPFKLIPYFDDFNHLLVIAKVDNKQYVLDATTKMPWNILPLEYADRDLLLLDGRESKLMWIESDINYAITSKNYFKITPDGFIHGVINKKYENYAKQRYAKLIKDNTEKEFIELSYNNNDVSIDSFTFNNYKVDSLPIETSVYVTYKNEIAPTADVLYINPISFFAFSNPFTAPKRVTNIDFGYQQIYEDMATFEMPANFHLADNLENVSFTSADESMIFNKIFIKSEKSIRIKCSIEINKKTYLNTEYAEVQKFYEKCVTELSNVIALKKINKDGF